jgi:hypothetical protein
MDLNSSREGDPRNGICSMKVRIDQTERPMILQRAGAIAMACAVISCGVVHYPQDAGTVPPEVDGSTPKMQLDLGSIGGFPDFIAPYEPGPAVGYWIQLDEDLGASSERCRRYLDLKFVSTLPGIQRATIPGATARSSFYSRARAGESGARTVKYTERDDRPPLWHRPCCQQTA